MCNFCEIAHELQSFWQLRPDARLLWIFIFVASVDFPQCSCYAIYEWVITRTRGSEESRLDDGYYMHVITHTHTLVMWGAWRGGDSSRVSCSARAVRLIIFTDRCDIFTSENYFLTIHICTFRVSKTYKLSSRVTIERLIINFCYSKHDIYIIFATYEINNGYSCNGLYLIFVFCRVYSLLLTCHKQQLKINLFAYFKCKLFNH